MLVDHGAFEFELYDAYRLVHLCKQRPRSFIVRCAARLEFRLEYLARVIGICFHGKCGQRHKIDAVSLFKCVHVSIAERYAEHVGYTAVVAGGSAHPQCVVVAPLYVESFVVGERVHDDMRALSSVVYVAEYVKPVYAEPLYHIAYGYYEIIRLSCRNDCLHDPVVIHLFAFAARSLVKKLLDDICVFFGKRFADFGSGVFR